MENAKSENPHSCHKKRDFRLLFYFLLSKDPSGAKKSTFENGNSRGISKRHFPKTKNLSAVYELLSPEFESFPHVDKKRDCKAGIFLRPADPGLIKRGSSAISDTRNTAEIFRLCQRSLRLIVR